MQSHYDIDSFDDENLLYEIMNGCGFIVSQETQVETSVRKRLLDVIYDIKKRGIDSVMSEGRINK